MAANISGQLKRAPVQRERLGEIPEFGKALREYVQALKHARRIDDQALIATTYNNIGFFFKDRGLWCNCAGDTDRAVRAFESAVDAAEKTVPPDLRLQATKYSDLGLVYQDRAQRMGLETSDGRQAFDQSRRFFLKALRLRLRASTWRRPDIDVAESWKDLGNLYRLAERTAKAMARVQRARTITAEALYPGHPAVATCLEMLGDIAREDFERRYQQRCYEAAYAHYREAENMLHFIGAPEDAQRLRTKIRGLEDARGRST